MFPLPEINWDPSWVSRTETAMWLSPKGYMCRLHHTCRPDCCRAKGLKLDLGAGNLASTHLASDPSYRSPEKSAHTKARHLFHWNWQAGTVP